MIATLRGVNTLALTLVGGLGTETKHNNTKLHTMSTSRCVKHYLPDFISIYKVHNSSKICTLIQKLCNMILNIVCISLGTLVPNGRD